MYRLSGILWFSLIVLSGCSCEIPSTWDRFANAEQGSSAQDSKGQGKGALSPTWAVLDLGPGPISWDQVLFCSPGYLSLAREHISLLCWLISSNPKEKKAKEMSREVRRLEQFFTSVHPGCSCNWNYSVPFWSLHPQNDLSQLGSILRNEGWPEVWNSFNVRKDCLEKDFKLKRGGRKICYRSSKIMLAWWRQKDDFSFAIQKLGGMK